MVRNKSMLEWNCPKKLNIIQKQLKRHQPHLLECNLAGSNDKNHRLGHQDEDEVTLFLFRGGRRGMIRFVGACLVNLSKKVGRKKTKHQPVGAVQRQKGKIGLPGLYREMNHDGTSRCHTYNQQNFELILWQEVWSLPVRKGAAPWSIWAGDLTHASLS